MGFWSNLGSAVSVASTVNIRSETVEKKRCPSHDEVKALMKAIEKLDVSVPKSEHISLKLDKQRKKTLKPRQIQSIDLDLSAVHHLDDVKKYFQS